MARSRQIAQQVARHHDTRQRGRNVNRTLERLITVSTVLISVCALIVAGVVTRRELKGRDAASGTVGAVQVRRQPRVVADWRSYLEGGHRIGPQAAKLTILEFGDYECPACAQFAKALKAFEALHPNEVALIYRHWPLEYHRLAYPAARAAECAGSQGRFSEYHSLLFAKHDSLGLIPFVELAERAGVSDLNGFAACSKMSAPVPSIQQSTAAVVRLGAPGTPALLVNGILLATLPDSALLERLLAGSK